MTKEKTNETIDYCAGIADAYAWTGEGRTIPMDNLIFRSAAVFRLMEARAD